MAMDLTLQSTIVTVHDSDLAIAFYRDTLGLAVTQDVAFGDFRWVKIGRAHV